PNGGVSPYQYTWSGSTSTNSSLSNLPAGTYTVTVTDANGCTATSMQTLTQPTVLSASAVTAAASCSLANGSTNISAAGGTPAYSFSFNGGANQSSGNFSSILPGSYNATVTDSRGCTVTIPVVVSNQPGPVATASTSTPVSCNGGSNGTASLITSGGTSPIGYSINGSPTQVSGAFSNLAAGTYIIIATDANGCTTSSSITVQTPTAITTSASSVNATCSTNNGSLSIVASGGTAPYTYSLNGGAATTSGTFNNLGAASYNITVTDANGCTTLVPIAVGNQLAPTISTTNSTPVSCNGGANVTISVSATGGTGAIIYTLNGSQSQSNGSYSGLTAGSYSVTATDANGCSAITIVTITQPTALTAVSSSGTITCYGGTTSVSVTSGGGPAPYAGTGSFTVGAGSYSYTVTDANGCSVVTNITVAQPTLLTSTATPSPALCNGAATGSVIVGGAGGTTPYTGTGTFSNLAAGSYSYTVTDANGCTSVVSATVTQPTLLTAASTSGAIACFGGTTSVNVTGGGGTAPYSGTGSFTVGAGSYSYTVTDANGCSVVTNITVAQPTLLTSSATPSPALCNGAATGSVIVSGAGGTTPYTGTGTFSNLAAG
ncbi:MAG: beta strand repeat-containing protein, partial [Bacteroidota bacterium]